MAAANANYNSNIVGVKRTTAVGDDQQETEVGFFFLDFCSHTFKTYTIFRLLDFSHFWSQLLLLRNA